MIKKIIDLLKGDKGEKTGVVESIGLTFGGAGNQVMTIDGVQYATWIDYSKWPKIGATVKHQPYKDTDGRGNDMLCTRILEQSDTTA